MKKSILLVIVCLFTVQALSQYDKFMVGFYSYDYDYRYFYTEPGTDYVIGNDIAYLRLVKNMNITTINIAAQLYYPKQYASSNPSKHFLDNADALGLDVILHCPDIDIDRFNNPHYDETLCDEGLNYYGNEPSVLGFSIVDEPSTEIFSIIDQYANRIENFNSSLLRSANLLPNYATKDQLFGSGGSVHPTYEEYSYYVQNYIDTNNPNFISFDGYPIWFNSNRFFLNLDTFAKKSALNNVPYVYVLTSLNALPDPFNCFSDPEVKSIEEFYYVIFASLVYNAKGISYWHNGCLNDFFGFIPINVQNSMEELHKMLIENSDILLDLEFQSVYHKTFNSTIIPNVMEQIHSDSQWSNFANDPIANQIFTVSNPITPLTGLTYDNLAISFLTDSFGSNYFWIYNKSVDNISNIRLNFNHELSLVDILEDKMYSECLSRNIYLKKGEAKLFKVNDNFYDSVSLCNQSFPFGIYPDVWSEITNIGGLSCNVNYYNGSNINYFSEKISINGGVSVNEGSDVSFTGVELEGCSSWIRDRKNTSSNEELFEYSGDFTIYPNPNSGKFSISSNGDSSKINSVQIFNLLGHKIVDLQNVDNLNFDLEHVLTNGTYIMKLYLADGSIVTDKIIII